MADVSAEDPVNGEEMPRCGDATLKTRRNRRKNSQPRSISQLSRLEATKSDDDDELEAYRINNRGADFNSNVLDLSHANGCSPGADDKSQLSVDNFGAIDLSVTSDVDSSPPPPLPPTKVQLGGSTEGAEAIKHYAENTVNELLEIYGFADDAQTAVTHQVPLSNFSPASILHRHTPSAKTPLRATSPAVVSQESPATTSSNDSSYASFTDCVSSLASLPQGAVINNSIIALPDTSLPHDHMMSPQSAADLVSARSFSQLCTTSSPVKSTNVSNFATSAAYVKACFDPKLAPKLAAVAAAVTPCGKNVLPNYSKYVKRYVSADDCKQEHCRQMSFKEHFHCFDCNFKVFVKKEEMIRHFKWHRKRDESLQHGFMRYSPVDDCSRRFGASCSHNGRQTHYHCLQPDCSKVYISTSDVQMHANYHRKDSAIFQEGFQRFRATENCGRTACTFYGQRTTHFHCRRPACSYTFKNKADMEKHKMYHQKDEILGADGFKKFMKYEHCGYDDCRYSKTSNHIHCIRPGCDYVLHSTGQLYSHKRKHERKDFEHAYKRFKDQQQQPAGLSAAQRMHSPTPTGTPPEGSISTAQQLVPTPAAAVVTEGTDVRWGQAEVAEDLTLAQHAIKMEEGLSRSASSSTLAKLASKLTSSASLSGSLNLPIPSSDGFKAESATDSSASSPSTNPAIWGEGNASTDTLVHGRLSPAAKEKRERNEVWKKYLTRYTANDPCNSRCDLLYKDHYHCSVASCGRLFRSKDGVREHAKFHEQQDRITGLCFMRHDVATFCQENCHLNRKELHYHCLWANCDHVVSSSDPVFSRLEHHKAHELSRQPGVARRLLTSMGEEMQRQKRRGRPPKNVRAPVVPKVEMTSEEMAAEVMSARTEDERAVAAAGFRRYDNTMLCPDERCYLRHSMHFHCARARCHHVTHRIDALRLHADDFHAHVNIVEGFEFFDADVDCRRPLCQNCRSSRHFHCMRCQYTFVRYTTMAQHARKHALTDARPIQPIVIQPIADDDDVMPSQATSSASLNLVCVGSGADEPQSDKQIAQTNQIKTEKLPTEHHHHHGSSTLRTIAPKPACSGTLSMLLQHRTPLTAPPYRSAENYAVQQHCGRPFCKLKRRNHYHCSDCHQAFSDESRLRVHAAKHRGQHQQQVGSTGVASNSLSLEHGTFTRLLQANMPCTTAAADDAAMDLSCNGDSSSSSTAVDSTPKRLAESPADCLLPSKHLKRDVNDDDDEIEGYKRYGNCDDCCRDDCTYRLSVTHFHCDQCPSAAFTDRDGLDHHTQRHIYLGDVIAADFVQIRAGMHCDAADACVHAGTAHFHCMHCAFTCVDTGRVLAHRRLHQKSAQITTARGFIRCPDDSDCGQNRRHSTQATAVVSQSQITAHRHVAPDVNMAATLYRRIAPKQSPVVTLQN